MADILTVKDLKIWDSRNDEVIVKGISFSLPENSCLAIVGESGSGKSMSTRSIMGLNKPWIRNSGEVVFDGVPILNLSQKEIRKLCGKRISMIMQGGMSAFDPSCTIGKHYREVLKQHLGYDKKQADALMIETMGKLLLQNPKAILGKYPHQLSGGMLQRCMIALTLALQPEIIIADEPTTALDTITQYTVIEQLLLLRKHLKCSMIFISHDLGVVKKVADYAVLMKQGELIEQGTIEELFENPKTDYAKHLVGTKRAMGEEFAKAMKAAQAGLEGGAAYA